MIILVWFVGCNARCSHWESNPRPTAYKAGALPTEL